MIRPNSFPAYLLHSSSVLLQHHQVPVTDMEQPLLVSRPKKKDQQQGAGDILLLPQLCSLTGLMEEMRANFTVMRDLAVHTRVGPENRFNKLTHFLREMNQNEAVRELMAQWGMRFAPNLTEVPARCLPSEKIWQGRDGYNYNPADAEWSREMRSKRLISCPPINQWAIICPRQMSHLASELAGALSRVANGMGMRLEGANMVQLNDNFTQSYTTALRQLDDSYSIVVCILSSNKKDLYDAIKKITCLERALPCQCIVQRTLNKKQMLMSVATKVAIQMNCKLGGEVWAVEVPLKDLMVVGIDTYHDSAQKGMSACAFVASMNVTLTRYYSRCTFLTRGQELTDGLRVCLQGEYDVGGWGSEATPWIW